MAKVKKDAASAAAAADGPVLLDDMEGAPTVHYVLYDDGSLGRIEMWTDQEPTLSKPGRIVTEAEYRAALEDMRGNTAARVQTLRDEDYARQEAEYDDLLTAGIPERTARRLSGFAGEE
ncbi:hypothetical protein M2168_002143 [Streptomyces sp. CZ24]|nr:hypothetical protein [Streptomyces sp. CZ24]MDH6189111.1 hypothetical protein [Streptomyces sp. CZ24]